MVNINSNDLIVHSTIPLVKVSTQDGDPEADFLQWFNSFYGLLELAVKNPNDPNLLAQLQQKGQMVCKLLAQLLGGNYDDVQMYNAFESDMSGPCLDLILACQGSQSDVQNALQNLCGTPGAIQDAYQGIWTFQQQYPIHN